ncbi:MAG: Lrp/AsnC family transcriptional regulator [archaeon]
MVLDELDTNIVRLLQAENYCVPKVNLIARALKVPTSTIFSRLKKLEKDGFLTGYSADVNSTKLGKELTVFALVKLEYPKLPENIDIHEIIAQKISNSSPKIQEVHALTGEWELLVKIKVNDHKDYYDTIKKYIIPAGPIVKVNALMALETFKETHFVYP